MTDLPILDELGEGVGRAARRRSRRGPVSAAVLAAATAALVVVLLATGGGSGRPLAERAFAAVAEADGVRHVVYDATLTRRRGPAIRERTEIWLSADGCRGRARYVDGRGRVRGDLSESARTLRIYDGRRNSVARTVRRRGDLWQVSDPVESFRALYRRGRVVETARFERDGRELVRLRLEDDTLTVTYLADAITLVPVEMVLRTPRRELSRTRIVTYEDLPAERAERFLDVPRYPGARERRQDLVRGVPPARTPRSQQRLHCYR